MRFENGSSFFLNSLFFLRHFSANLVSKRSHEMTQYIRVKRTNQTIFLSVDSNDTITEVKKKISSIIKTSADNIKLLSESERKEYPDEKTLGDLKVDNEAILYWVQKKDGTDEWETVNIQKVEQPKQDDKEEK